MLNTDILSSCSRPIVAMVPAVSMLFSKPATRIEQDLVELAEALIAVFADRFPQEPKISEVTEAPWKIAFVVER